MEVLNETVGWVGALYIERSLVGETCVHCSKSAESAREPLITPAQSRPLHIWSGSFRVTSRSHRRTHAHANYGREGNINIHQHTKNTGIPECIISWLNMHALCRQSSEDEQHCNIKDWMHILPPCTHTPPHKHWSVSLVIYWPFYTQLRWPPPALTLHYSSAQGRRCSNWKHFPKNPQAQKVTMPLSISAYEGFNLVAWRSKMHIGIYLLLYRSVPLLLFPVLNYTASDPHCSMLYQTVARTVGAHTYNALAL